ncbi:MAG: S24 family peptidase [Gammaproteobacteria bacterium]|jgi:signal peptidase I|nr:S24 family peptidase [Gammaproteobacteria bacterium]MBT3951578.1 S24 family peptidase [Candidatus Neomarinimicrobiota bacterium]MBT4608327.1 S24 family peptidase [Thiotrichales bacterium]MBT3846221.1 S24 family peptidase [Gammaproteobacteria bacterium]MBT4301010.1 S24 family peptidase [Gammaproteobacteria bacterium]
MNNIARVARPITHGASQGFADGPFLAAFYSMGDSMQPTLEPGQPILLDIAVDRFTEEGIYAIRINGDIYLKRLKRAVSGEIHVISDNATYEMWTLKPEMNAQIIGRMARALDGDVVGAQS